MRPSTRTSSSVWRFVVSASAVVVPWLHPVCLHGQEFRASIKGQITDPSGAPIPNAVVTARNLDTQQTYTDKSGVEGTYALQYLLPGPYVLAVEAKGFARKVFSNLSLESAQKLSMNAAMETGANIQTIDVTASAGLLNTDSASGGSVLNQTKVENMSSEGQQSWQDLVFTQGVRLISKGPFNTTPRNNTDDVYTVNGAPVTANAFYINGAPVSDQGTWYFVPLQDSIEELQAASPPYDAQYGRAGGGSFNAVVKSGTNRVRGDLYYFNENSALGAATYAQNLTGLRKSLNNETTFGASAGGPIRKNKTFFFASYGGWRQSFGMAVSDSVPAASWRPLPDGSVSLSQSGFTVYDPLTATCVTPSASGCSTYNRKAFAGDIIPANRISPTGKAILSYYPAPNTGGIASNYNIAGRNHLLYDQYLGRVDQNFSEKMRLYAMFGYQRNWATTFGTGFPNGATTGGNPTGHPMLAMLDLTRTFTPSLVGDVRLSWTRYTSFTSTGQVVPRGLSADTIGLSMPFVPTTTHQDLFPTFTVSGLSTLFGNTQNGTIANDMGFSASLAQTKGHHYLHYGFDFLGIQSAAGGIPGQPNGTFSFTGQWTRLNPLSGGTNSAQSFADLLLGYPAGGSVSWNTNTFVTYHAYGLYMQDDYKILRNLTLNLGLRWDVYTSATERFHRINAGFCTTCPNPYDSQISRAKYPNLPALTGGLLFAGAGGVPAGPFDVRLNNFQPRVGIAWAVTPKWVLRAGYGIFTAPGLLATTSTGFSQTTSYVNSLDGGVTPSDFFLSGKPYPNGVVAPAGSSGGLGTSAGQAVTFNAPDRRAPQTQQWTFGLQRELPGHILMDLEYAGSHTHPFAVSTQLNAISSAQAAQCFQNPAICNANVPNPFFGVLPAAASLGASATVPAYQLALPWPLFTGVTASDTPAGSSHYNALEVRVERKIESFDFVINYVYSNWMDRNTYLNNGVFRDANFWSGPDANDRRNYFDSNVVAPLPFGRGRWLAKNVGGWRGALLSGWMASSQLVWYTGVPMDIPAANFSGPGCTSYVPAGGQNQAHLINNNVACYHDLTPYQPRTTPLRVGYLRYPSLVMMDAAVRKRFMLPREGMSLQFRVESANVLNHPNFLNAISVNNDQPPVPGPTGWTGFGTRSQTQNGDPRSVVVSLKLYF